MTTAEIVAEINEHREAIDASSRRIYELSRTLHASMRGTTTATDVGVYVTYSNVWTRFAGMIQQGLQRVRQADRVLRLVHSEEADREAPPVEPSTSHPQPVENQAHSMPASSSLDDFMSLYGEELVSDADRQPR